MLLVLLMLGYLYFPHILLNVEIRSHTRIHTTTTTTLEKNV